jgi:hypothetical protein
VFIFSCQKLRFIVLHLSVIQINEILYYFNYAFNKGAGGPHPPLILNRFLLYLLLYLLLYFLLYFFICLHLLLQICLLRDFLFDPNKEFTKPLKEKEPDAIIK